MTLSFRDALKIQRDARGLSLRAVAKGAGVSENILKNVNQAKSEKPNAEAAMKIASFFRVSLQEFYEGVVVPDADAGPSPTERLLAEIKSVGPENRDAAVEAALATVRAVKNATS